MLANRFRIVLILVMAAGLSTCIEPYSPNISGYRSLLVVDGLITDADNAYGVILSKTFPDPSGTPDKINNASVLITDSGGNKYFLQNNGDGKYMTDSTEFRGKVGETYTLHITLEDGSEYQSDPCTMQPVSDIDSIYFEKDQQFMKNATLNLDGISIYVDSKATSSSPCYRWSYEETWKFNIPYPASLKFVNDTTVLPVQIKNVNCWKFNKSDEVIVQEADPVKSWKLNKVPIIFIPSGESDRLMIEYSILVKQYSLSREEYNFWNNIQKVNQTGSDIFASVPYSVSGNIHNMTKPDERVLGYFQVSAVKQKREFIKFDEIVGLGIPYFNNQCQLFTPDPSQYRMSLSGLYSLFLRDSTYALVEVIYNEGSNRISRLVFAKTECSICTKTGTARKPDYWPD